MPAAYEGKTTMGFNLDRLLQVMAPGPLAQTLFEFTPLQREILIALLTGEEEHPDERLAREHGLSVGEIRRRRGEVDARLSRSADRSA